MPETLSIPNATPLRDELQRIGLARLRKHKSPILIGGSIKLVYLYYFRARMAAWIMDDAIVKHYPDHPDSNSASAMINSVINTDITRVTIDLAAAAWLTIDEWRLHVEFPDLEIPTDLSYGLVLQYPEPILRQARFLAGESVRDELQSIDQSLVSESKQFAIAQLRKIYRDRSDNDLYREVNRIPRLGYMPTE